MHLTQISLRRQAHADVMADSDEAEGRSRAAEGDRLVHRFSAAATAVDGAENVGERRRHLRAMRLGFGWTRSGMPSV
jgi:hypothetical protein